MELNEKDFETMTFLIQLISTFNYTQSYISTSTIIRALLSFDQSSKQFLHKFL